MSKIPGIRGMNDLLPLDARKFNHIISTAAHIFEDYGFDPIYVPLLEKTELFTRSIGAHTEVVEKEMYTFLDRNNESLSLRPEGTAGCVRALIEHSLAYNQTPKLWYAGPMFRYERPQKGRYRQFHQLGVEAFGLSGPDIDADLIALSKTLLDQWGLHQHVRLELNTLGQKSERDAFRHALTQYLKKHYQDLDEDSQRRLEHNPLRIFDSKVASTQALLKEAPRLETYLGLESRQHFEGVKKRLDLIGIPYQINHHLVRGLDYYNLTSFEWTTDLLGAQSAICGGGRYDTLVQELGGDATPAVGFAVGLERLMLLLDTLNAYPSLESPPHFYLIMVGEAAQIKGFEIAHQLREQHFKVILNYGDQSFKSQFKKADKSAAGYALILGDNEISSGKISLKNLRQEEAQVDIDLAQLIPYLKRLELKE